LIFPVIVYYENVLVDCSAVVMVISEVEVGAEDGSDLPGFCVTADDRMTSVPECDGQTDISAVAVPVLA